MQEDVVGWDPITIWHPVPWFVKIYLFYLLYAIVRCMVRLAMCAKGIWRDRAATPPNRIEIELASLRRTVFITILGGLFVGLYGVSNVLHVIAFDKVHAPEVIAANLSEAIAPVAFGFAIALIVYVATALLESRFEKRVPR